MSEYFNIEIETYEKNKKSYVFIANDGSSGCEYEYKDREELKNIVANYVRDMLSDH